MGKLSEEEVRKYLKADRYSIPEEFQQSLQILIALLFDLSGGVIRLGDVCTLSKIKRFEDYQVSLFFFIEYSFCLTVCVPTDQIMISMIHRVSSSSLLKEKKQS